MNEYGRDLAYIHHAGFSEFAESAAPGLLEILWRHGVRDGLVVEVGCGSGILAHELTRAGFDVLGYDASPAMIALAREQSGAPRFEVGAFDAIDIPACNAIVAMGEVLNYGTFAGVRKLIANAETNLLIFDIAERGAYPPYDEHRVEGDDWSVIAIKESDGTRLTRRILTFRADGDTMRRAEEVHALELYDRAAMKALLREHGFGVQVRRSYGIWNGTRRLPKGHAVYVCVRS
ncbi:MAG TPA: methyltransferase domain-containing protein [Thermoanaerobaculia bacterium]|nr:methyltransferase domain-containing protein [Thermoanaerobaculia bacterium]